MDSTPYGLSCEWTQPRWDSTPNGLNPERTQPWLGLNPEWTQPRKDSTLTGTQPRMDSTQKGLNLKFLSTSNGTISTPALFFNIKQYTKLKKMDFKKNEHHINLERSLSKYKILLFTLCT
jgi:hypothetical protein